MTTLHRITRVLTVPGLWVRAFWVHLLCRIWAMPVEETALFRRGVWFGHLRHAPAESPGAAFALCFVPAFLNRLLALLLFLTALFGLFLFQMTGFPAAVVYALSYWFAFSLYVNSAAHPEDVRTLRALLKQQGTAAQKVLLTPGAVCCAVGAVLEQVCVTFLLAAAGLIFLLLRHDALFAFIARLLPAVD